MSTPHEPQCLLKWECGAEACLHLPFFLALAINGRRSLPLSDQVRWAHSTEALSSPLPPNWPLLTSNLINSMDKNSAEVSPLTSLTCRPHSLVMCRKSKGGRQHAHSRTRTPLAAILKKIARRRETTEISFMTAAAVGPLILGKPF